MLFRSFTYLTEKHPTLPEPFNNLAMIYIDLGDYDKAQKLLESAIKINPNYIVAFANLGDLYSKRAFISYSKVLESDKTNLRTKNKILLIDKALKY